MTSMEWISFHLSTLRGRLVIGAVALLALMGTATWIGYATVEELTEEINQRLSSLASSTEIGNDLERLIMDQVAAGEAYLASGDESDEARFAVLGRRAHEMRAEYKELPGLTSAELSQIETLESLHARIEVEYALAHALLDVGRTADALARAEAVEPIARDLQASIRGIAAAQAAKVSTAAATLEEMGSNRQDWLLIVLTLALGFGTWILYAAVRGINQPLSHLIIAAQKLGTGDLRVQVDPQSLREFDALAVAFNTMAAQLRTLVSETVGIAEQISASASDLSSISEQVAASSGEVATAMVEITSGAEGQSQGLQTTTAALEEMGRRTTGMEVASQRVSHLSNEIHQVASGSRDQVTNALAMLLEIREFVQSSGNEVGELERASSRIDKFVETISGIARQTNLLALNAAIEAARAGEHGRGFAVVADEVRKLAEGSANAADEVAETVHEIRSKIRSTVQTMERGSATVAGVEKVSRDADTALEQIMSSIGEIRGASQKVAEAVGGNQEAARGVDLALQDVSGTAESHAASAEEVSAAAEQQSAATEEMSAASSQLLLAAERMRELVSGWNT
ncbi:MAG TPA: methyl-accepting chemotaxis protein [Longimicrobiaceae bacterium]|nr:methyl-accepting chemotaxis protein [Longimicrobiaceae bacterium]